MEKTIMAIGGHIGDAELTCGGVLATYALKGYKIITVALTGGERGNPPHLTVEEYRNRRKRKPDVLRNIWAVKLWYFPMWTENCRTMKKFALHYVI